jgi:hypothetical protein
MMLNKRAIPLACAVFCATAPAAPASALTTANDQVSEAEARSFIASWLEAQNQGDFAAYSILYGAQFHGVRRSKNRVATFDRDGWLRDRQRMFRAPMHVEASAIAVTVAQPTRVTFTQRWRSGGFADEGTKVMSLAREASAIRLLSEELLDSHPLSPDSSKAPMVALVAGVGDNDDQAEALLAQFEEEQSALGKLILDNDFPRIEASGAKKWVVVGYCSKEELEHLQDAIDIFYPSLKASPADRSAPHSCPEPIPSHTLSKSERVDIASGRITTVRDERWVCCDCGFDDDTHRSTYVLVHDLRGRLVDSFVVEDKLTNVSWDPPYRDCSTEVELARDTHDVALEQICTKRLRNGSEKMTSHTTWHVSFDGSKLRVKKQNVK